MRGAPASRKLFARNQTEDAHMHASHAFVNGAGDRRRSSGSRTEGEELRLLKTLLSTATSESPRPATDKVKSIDRSKSIDKGKSKDERQAEEESSCETVSRPGGFKNHPDDPTNPNEVRERHLNKIKR
jgi:hypothetical protein